MDRVFGTLEIRSLNDELREFTGIANTAALDDHDSIVEPAGARFSLPIPLLWFHDQQNPIGEITHAELRDGKWHVKGSIRTVAEPGRVKDATDQAWHSLKYKLVRGLSIGFKALKVKGNRFIEWAWRELSIVSIPSNQEASIVSIRSAYVAASGETPGVSGTPTTVSFVPVPGTRREIDFIPRHGKMTIQEQITQHENSRAAKVARQSALMEAAGAAGETLGETEAEEYDTLTREVEAVDGHLTRLSSLKRANETALRPVNGSGIAAASQSRGNGDAPTQNRNGVPVVRVRANTEPGIGFARCAMALLRNGGNRLEAMEDARRTWPDQAPEMELVLRAAVAAGTTADATWAAPLVQPATLASEFLEFLRPKTLLGRIPGLTKVDFNSRVTSQTGTGTYNWTGEGKPKPLTALAFAAVTLAFNKVTGIIVMTDELVRFSTPAAEARVRDDMTKGIAGFMDNQFLDPTITAIAGVRPAAITEGVAGTAASGTTEAAARTDIRALLNGFGDIDIGDVVLLMKPGFGFTLGTMVNALGQPAFPGIGINGGNLLGVPVITSNATSLATQIVAVHTPSILIADDGGVTIDMSREASLQMDSAPDNPVVDTTVMVSLWQHNMLGLRAERAVTWLRARTGSVRRIHTAAYV